MRVFFFHARFVGTAKIRDRSETTKVGRGRGHMGVEEEMIGVVGLLQHLQKDVC